MANNFNGRSSQKERPQLMAAKKRAGADEENYT